MTLVSVIHTVPLKIEPAPGMPTQANHANASVTTMAKFPDGTSGTQPSMMSHLSHWLDVAPMSQAVQSSHRYHVISIQRVNLPGEIWRSSLSHIWGDATLPNLDRPMTLVSDIHIVQLKIGPAPSMPAQANTAIASVTYSNPQPAMMTILAPSLMWHRRPCPDESSKGSQDQRSHRYCGISIQKATFPGRSGGAPYHIYGGTPLFLTLTDP